MRRDHRPYYLKKAHLRFQEFYVRRFIRPQLERLGKHPVIFNPRHLALFGSPIYIGDNVNIITNADAKVRISIWSDRTDIPGIRIGNCCLVCPGVRIGAAESIVIEDDCMLAGKVYITDADWHGIYNRVSPGKNAPVHLAQNVWVGDSAIVCKGVTIGRNSVIGAGSVVTNDIPPNCIAAGNPAVVVRALDPEETIVTRSHWFADLDRLKADIEKLDAYMLGGNTLLGWLRSLLFPRKGD